RYTGMLLQRKAKTVKSAGQSINCGSRKYPAGTANSKKPSGNAIRLAICQPNTAGTARMINSTSADWVTTLIATKSPASQTAAVTASSNQAEGDGRGCCASKSNRMRQISHNE